MMRLWFNLFASTTLHYFLLIIFCHIMEPVPWIDRNEYPFVSRSVMIEGHQIHYVDEDNSEHTQDEGIGNSDQKPVLLMVHGTPVWSFLYRHCLKAFSSRYRCIALDHLGFGLSDKPQTADYSPQAHARRLASFVKALGLKNLVLVAQDYGGPIALDYAVRHADNVRGIVLANTWMWEIQQMRQGGKLFDNALGKWLYIQYGFSPKVLIPQSFGDKQKLLPAVHRHYLMPLSTPKERVATFSLVEALHNNAGWYEELWQRREAIASKPVLMVWGMKDRFVPGAALLPRWKQLWRNARYVECAEAGHFVEEEDPERVMAAMGTFLREQFDAHSAP
jgi:haloalkane dehalogenase